VPSKATSFDIAYQAGVSQPTVSRALRGSPQVSEETRKRVLAVAQQLNYKVDKNASNLRFQHSNTLALLIFEDPTADDSAINPFFVSMLGSVTRACAQRGYDLLVSFQQQSGNWHEEYEDSRRADGLILLGYGDYLQYRIRLERLTAQGTHFVRWGAVQPGQPGLSIGSDNCQGGYEAARHLIGLRRRKLAFLVAPREAALNSSIGTAASCEPSVRNTSPQPLPAGGRHHHGRGGVRGGHRAAEAWYCV